MINSTTAIMENMNDIVWATKEDESSFEILIDRMRNFAMEMTDAKGIELVFEADKKTYNLPLDMQQRKNINLFFKEAVNNAIKHSDCNRLEVSISCTSALLCIIIKDNGIGFLYNSPLEWNAMASNGLKSMQFRAEQIKAEFTITSSPGNGTTLKLLIPLK